MQNHYPQGYDHLLNAYIDNKPLSLHSPLFTNSILEYICQNIYESYKGDCYHRDCRKYCGRADNCDAKFLFSVKRGAIPHMSDAQERKLAYMMNNDIRKFLLSEVGAKCKLTRKHVEQRAVTLINAKRRGEKDLSKFLYPDLISYVYENGGLASYKSSAEYAGKTDCEHAEFLQQVCNNKTPLTDKQKAYLKALVTNQVIPFLEDEVLVPNVKYDSVSNLTSGQEKAIKQIKDWWSAKPDVYRLGGAAGTGKSSIIPNICEALKIEYDEIKIMAPTGKAANNLNKKGLKCRTIHSSIYDWLFGEKIGLKDRRVFAHTKLIIIDEASMVGSALLDDILQFKIPVLLIGDPYQLPPVRDLSVFSNCNIYLDQLCRQKADSPIVYIANKIRNREPLKIGSYGDSKIIGKDEEFSPDDLMSANIILTNDNANRKAWNEHMRAQHGVDTSVPLHIGEKVICRKNDNTNMSDANFTLTNGTSGVITQVYHRSANGKLCIGINAGKLGNFIVKAALDKGDGDKGDVWEQQIQYAYAITAHLSQGDEYNRVLYDCSEFLPASNPEDNWRALYTGVTRAKESIILRL